MVLNIVDIVENNIVNAMNNNIQIVSFEDAVIVVKNTLWTRKNTILTDDLDNEYKVIDVDYTLNQITLNTDYIGSNKIVTIPIPFYYHGTPMVTNAEWKSQNVPFIWLVEPVQERGEDSNSSIERESELVLLFVDNRDDVNWLNNDIHAKRSQSLLNMAESFEKAINDNPYMFKRGVSSFDKRNLAKLGRESREGFVSHILDADLTAVDLRGSLFIYRSNCASSSSLPSCLPVAVKVYNGNESININQLIISGGSFDYAIPNMTVTVKDQNGNNLGSEVLPAGVDGIVDVNLTPPSCDDGTVDIKNSNNQIIETVTIPSGGLEETYIGDTLVEIVDTDNNLIYSNSYPATVGANIEAPNGNVVLKKSIDTEIETVTVKSNETKEHLISPSNISVNGNDFVSLPATDPLDVILVDQDNNELIPTIDGNKLTVEMPPLQGRMPLKTGQSDDGSNERGRNIDFFTLSYLNPFGHNCRFVGKTGGYHDRVTDTYKDVNGTVTTKILAFPNSVMYDFDTWNQTAGTVLAFYFGNLSLRNFASQATFESGLTIEGWTNWRVFNFSELFSLNIDGLSSSTLGWKPLEIGANAVGSCTYNSTQYFGRLANGSYGFITKASTSANLAVRVCTVTGIIIT